MANTGFKGIDVRLAANELVFRALLQTSGGALVTSGATILYIYEMQSDGTIKTYDFNDNTFKTTVCTTPTLALAYRRSNNATVDTGLWTVALATLTGFTVGAVYIVHVQNSGAFPTDQQREFQFGSVQGDFVVSAGGGVTLTAGEHTAIQTDVQTGLTVQGYTAARAAKLDDLDAAISTRSVYAGGPVASVTGSVNSVTQPVQTVTPQSGTVVVGSTTSVVIVQGLPTGPVVGGQPTPLIYAAPGQLNQDLLRQTGGERRTMLSQTFDPVTGHYTFTFGTVVGAVKAGPFTLLNTGDVVIPI